MLKSWSETRSPTMSFKHALNMLTKINVYRQVYRNDDLYIVSWINMIYLCSWWNWFVLFYLPFEAHLMASVSIARYNVNNNSINHNVVSDSIRAWDLFVLMQAVTLDQGIAHCIRDLPHQQPSLQTHLLDCHWLAIMIRSTHTLNTPSSILFILCASLKN